MEDRPGGYQVGTTAHFLKTVKDEANWSVREQREDSWAFRFTGTSAFREGSRTPSAGHMQPLDPLLRTRDPGAVGTPLLPR